MSCRFTDPDLQFGQYRECFGHSPPYSATCAFPVTQITSLSKVYVAADPLVRPEERSGE